MSSIPACSVPAYPPSINPLPRTTLDFQSPVRTTLDLQSPARSPHHSRLPIASENNNRLAIPCENSTLNFQFDFQLPPSSFTSPLDSPTTPRPPMPPTIADFVALTTAPYKLRDGPGSVYVLGRINKRVLIEWLTGVIDDRGLLHLIDLKVGSTTKIDRRRREYRYRCQGEWIHWYYHFPSFHRMRLEDLVHKALDFLGARARTYPCVGCGEVHGEHFSAWVCGGPEGLELVIRLCQAFMGEASQRQDLSN
ncbi:hypothetical protein DFH09DRAFT_1329646 [Mycena vulgaris]|nr:hypothetical protein DFH09DRAFT_1329646 [Mycena vulgaris]